MRRGLSWMMLAAAVAVAGCGRPPAEPLVRAAPEPQPYVPGSSSGGFDSAVKAGLDADRLAPALADRYSFTPGRQRQAISQASRAIRQAEQSLNRSFDYDYRPTGWNESVPWHKGWRLIGRCWVWEIEDAVKAGNWDTAARKAVAATQFACRVTGGDYSDASLGFVIAAEVRAALAPHLAKMSASSLRTLATGLQKALADQPPAGKTLEHEQQRVRLGIQDIMDAYSGGRMTEIDAKLGRSVKPATEHLARKIGSDAAPGYFRGFTAEADELARLFTEWSEMPVAERPRQDPLDEEGDFWPKGAQRPWRKFTPHLMTGYPLIVSGMDLHLARTRLFALSALIEAQIKAQGSAPRSLAKMPAALRTDPYTGQEFPYRSEGKDYRLWSAGSDGVNSGGASDESGLRPDLILDP